MEEAAPRRRSIAFAVVLWLILTAMLVGIAGYAIAGSPDWSLASGLLFLVPLWAALTGWIVRQRWPNNRLARLLPETYKGERIDQPQQVPALVIVVAVVLLVALVGLSLFALLR